MSNTLSDNTLSDNNNTLSDNNNTLSDNKISGVLSDKQIRYHRNETKDIVIEPYNENNLSNSSYDFTLGEYFYASKYYDNNINEDFPFFCPWNPEHLQIEIPQRPIDDLAFIIVVICLLPPINSCV